MSFFDFANILVTFYHIFGAVTCLWILIETRREGGRLGWPAWLFASYLVVASVGLSLYTAQELDYIHTIL